MTLIIYIDFLQKFGKRSRSMFKNLERARTVLNFTLFIKTERLMKSTKFKINLLKC